MKDIGFSQYCITKDGEVYSLKINRWIKKQISNNDYYVVSMGADNGTRYRKKVRRLLLQMFEPIDNDSEMFCNHKDGDKLNNNLSNLEWCTPLENSQHAHSNNLIGANFVNEHTKLPKECEIIYTDEDELISGRKELDVELIHRIFQKLQDGYRVCDVSKMIGVERKTIASLVNNPSKEISEILKEYDLSKRYKAKTLSVEKVIKICEMLSQGETPYFIAKELNIDYDRVRHIRNRKSFKDIGATYEW